MEPVAQALRAEVEDLLFLEAELLDAWRLDDWFQLLTEDVTYFVPPNDKPDADYHTTLFTIADDVTRLKERLIRLKDPSCHVEYPPSRTRRFIANVRVRPEAGGIINMRANFIVHRYRRNDDLRVFTGEYRNILARRDGALKIAERRAILDAEELGALGSVSFIL
ncbi:MAG TPA: aromatic-ring-hydroxylating dioxygenase subunit beta [Beijerinckiaceae bacterium]|nr:aromatic-ring-hydroxylating dioxygenase subunit beta [Beijerinckiaceae bacterium]